MASAAARADVIDSSRQIGVRDPRRQERVMAQVVGGERLLDQQQVEGVELGEVRGVVERVGGVGVDLQRRGRRRSARGRRATRSMSQPGSIFSLMRR